MKTNFFPEPSDLTQDTPLQHCINMLRDRVLRHDFTFLPEYQHRKYFLEAGRFLKEHKWNLQQIEGGLWNITPMI